MSLPVNYHETHYSIRRLVREEYISQQKGLCHHCRSSLHRKPPRSILSWPINRALFPIGFFDWPIHLHHDHNTGMTIGAVYSYCNAVLWQYHGE